MIEIETESNVELPTNASFIKYDSKIETSYEQILPNIQEMKTGCCIYVNVHNNYENEEVTVLFRTNDGSMINGENTYSAKGGDKLLFIVGQEKYSVIHFPSVQPLNIDESELQDIRNNLNSVKSQYDNVVVNISDNAKLASENASKISDNKTFITNNSDKISSNQIKINENLSSIATNSLSIGKVQDDINTKITGVNESIDGLQHNLSHVISQLSEVYDGTTNGSFYLEPNVTQSFWYPQIPNAQSFIEFDSSNGYFQIYGGKEYHLKIDMVSQTTFLGTQPTDIDFGLMDSKGQWVYDENGNNIHQSRLLNNGDQGCEFRFDTKFVVNNDEKVRFMFNVNPTLNDSNPMQFSDQHCHLTIYSNTGLLYIINKLGG